MPVLSSAVSALSTFYQDSLDPFDKEQVEISTVRLLAKLPTIAAYAYKKSVGQPFLYPDNSLSLPENFLRMTFGFPAEPYDVDPDMVKALDLLLILHADHEQNCSTSTVRLVGSPRPTCSPRSRPASTRCPARCTAAPTRRSSRCSTAIHAGRRRRRHLRQEGQEQGGRRQADGLRPPGLQELRPARRDHQEDRRHDPRARTASPTRCSTSPCSSSSARSRTTTSSSASSTRTSTSTPA